MKITKADGTVVDVSPAEALTLMSPGQKALKASQLLGAAQPLLSADSSVLQLFEAMAAVSKTDADTLGTGLTKATYNESSSATSGLTAYDLEGPAKLLYPVLTPLRNMIPRVSGKGGIQAAWRAITAINTGNISAGVSEGNRGGVIAVATQDYLAAYRGIGYESSATFEAVYAGETYDDVRMRAAQAGLHSLMLAEERLILGGNASLALGITPTPSLTASSAGGTLATQTISVICVSLTQSGFVRNTIVGGLTQTYTRSNADGTTDTINGGVGQKSTAATTAVTGPTGRCVASVTAVRGAMAYAWYWGASGSETLGAITTVPTVGITATATGAQLASALVAADYSTDGLIFDGLLTQALKPGSGAYWKDLGGATLTAGGQANIPEIDDLLQYQWDTWRLNPDTMWVSSRQARDIGTKIAAGGANSNVRFVANLNQGALGGNVVATGYLNSSGMDGATEVKIRQHPNLTPGTILFTQSVLPYPMNDVNNIMQMRMRQDYYQIEWPRRSRKYEYGIYADGVLQHYAPFSMCVLTGIGAG